MEPAKKLSSAIMQGVIQGETVPQMAKRLESVSDMDHRAAIRNARTMVTGAQNAGRIDAAKRAKNMGIGVTNVWMATLDMRTRHEHRVLDGQRREVDDPFEVEGQKIRFPGDPEAAPQLVYNCRCTLIPQVKGFEYDIRSGDRVDYSALEKEGLDYEAWKASRVEKPNPITLPEEKAAAIKGSYINEYKQLRKKTLDNSGNSGIIKKDSLSIYHNSSESVFTYAKKVAPEEGFEDIFIHGDKNGFSICNAAGKEIDRYNPLQFADILKLDPNYHGGNIRLFSCETGAEGAIAAQAVADALGVVVKAPTDLVWIGFDGSFHVGPDEYTDSGRWEYFAPKPKE